MVTDLKIPSKPISMLWVLFAHLDMRYHVLIKYSIAKRREYWVYYPGKRL